eukprot:TRINITY_DN112411_c0_g1_i1.p1 TRINITY_DN112411_c0_g1~~TRINITY_DN112411_c0_g1_i1.p1  ORF type:complete len:373 (-),score=27.17 TRINITY_DN112411_c0_g1_i1:55-1173(-)
MPLPLFGKAILIKKAIGWVPYAWKWTINFNPAIRLGYWLTPKSKRLQWHAKTKGIVRKHPRRVALFFGSLGGITALHVALNYRWEEVPITGRRQFYVLSERDTEDLLNAANSLLGEKQLLPANCWYTQHVKRVVRRIVEGNIDIFKTKFDGKLSVCVIEDPEFNAFVTAGGKVCVNTGLLDQVTTDELAYFVGHELAHALAKHVAEGQWWQQVTQSMSLLVFSGFGILVPGWASALRCELVHRWIVPNLLEKPFSRSQETEADYIGAVMASKAGYPPEAVISLWNRLAGNGDKDIQQLMSYTSTHPSHDKRQHDLEEHLPELQALYLASPWTQQHAIKRAWGHAGFYLGAYTQHHDEHVHVEQAKTAEGAAN